MHRWKALFLTLLAFASCVACTAPMPAKSPPACRHEVGVVERAFTDALSALSIPARLNGAPIDQLPVRMLPTRGTAVAAVTVVAGEITVMYDRDVMEKIMCEFGYDAGVAVFGHELGHVLNALLDIEDTELAADTWAGCALGITIGDLGAFSSLLATFKPGGTHPPAKERSAAASEGYGVCLKMMWERGHEGGRFPDSVS